MSQIDLIDGKWCDIVFDGKNKEYGAYVLRKGTGKRNVIAIVAVIVLIALCLIAIQALNAYDEYQKRQEAIRAEIELSKLQEKKKEEVKKEEPIIKIEQKPVEVKQNTVKFTAPVIKKDDQVKEENMLLNMEDLNKDQRSTGDENYDQGTNDRTAEKGSEVVEAPKVEEAPPPPPAPKEEETKVYDVVEQMPQFAGGNVQQWLASNLKYPPVAAENGIEGRVIVQFVVGKDGSISHATVVRGVDSSLDKEAIRAVNAMPKWIPGKQNGQSVNCKFTLPVVFRLQ